jgi:hypothetical protein
LPLIRGSKLFYTTILRPHSHSIVFNHGNALIFQRKFLPSTAKNRRIDPSKICALEFKGNFRGFGICSFSPIIEIDWSICEPSDKGGIASFEEKRTVSHDE